MRGKTQKLRVQSIQKEQYQLAQVENIVTKLLSKVNESINELKVEELDIKSNLVEHYTNNFNDDQPTTSAQAALRLNVTSLVAQDNSINIKSRNSPIDMEGIENINQQMLALESLLVPLKQKHYVEMEEEEDDDDDDDVDDNEDEDYEYCNTENEESGNEE